MLLSISKVNNFKFIFSNIDGGRILDVACGVGQFIKILQDNLRSWIEIYGIDVNDNYLSEARIKFPGERCHFIKGNSEQIPYPDNVFNLVSLSKGLHHVTTPEFALNEMKRVLSPSGYLVINEMYSDGLTESQTSHKLYHHLRVELDKIVGINHFHTFKKNEIMYFAKKLKLFDTVMYEYIEDQNDPFNSVVIKGYLDKMDTWLEQIKDHEMLNYFQSKIMEIRERIWKVGITRPPQLVIVGKK